MGGFVTATTGRIAFVLQEQRIAIAESASVASRYGNRARRDDEPIPTALASVDDAQIIADARMDLYGRSRRAFTVEAQGIEKMLDIPRAATCRLIDPQKNVDRLCLLNEVQFDFGEQQSTMEVWG